MVRVVGAESTVVGDSRWQSLVTPLWIGATNGFVLWILTYLLSHYVINNIACRLGTSFVSCSATDAVSAGIALVVAAVVTLALLVRERIYRPLLVVLAASFVLWGIGGTWLGGASWSTFFFTLLVSALVYTTFAWLARVRSFVIALIVTIIAVIVLRLVLVG